MHPHLRDLMRFLYIKEEVGYEEFLAAVYEAETEGTGGKILNIKAKAMIVEKVVDKNEPTDLQDIKQQIESLATIMKSTTVGNIKLKEGEGVSSPKKKPPCHIKQIQHNKLFTTQSQEHMLQSRIVETRTETDTRSLNTLQIPNMGNK